MSGDGKAKITGFDYDFEGSSWAKCLYYFCD